MWFSLFLLLFLIATTYFQAIQGLTSALITAVLTVICAAIAFGTYEYVAELALTGFAPDFAHGIAFLGTFLIPLGILRLVMDNVIARASMVPHLLDRIGAGVIGFFTAFLATGMLALGLQMVPWPAIIGYQRFNQQNPQDQNDVWLSMDRAAASYGVALSNGVFGGSMRFGAEHPDLVTELGWLQAGLNGSRRSAPADALTFQAASEIANVYDAKGGSSVNNPLNYEPAEPGAGKKFLRVTLKVSGDTAKLADSDDRQRYVPAAIRLVGTTNEQSDIYCGIAVPDNDQPNYFVRSWEENGLAANKRYVAGQTLTVPATGVIEVVFEVPKAFQPRMVKYKFGAEAPFRGTVVAQAPPPAPIAPTPTPTPTGGGRVTGVALVFGGSHFGAELPVTMTAYQGSAEVQNGAMGDGSIQGPTAQQGSTRQSPEVKSFEVPAGKALLHLNVESLKAGSMYGKALNFAAQTVENYILEDDKGNQLTPVGKYAVAQVGNQEVIEIQYHPQVGGRVQPFQTIKSVNLQKDYQLVYLYLMDSGAKAVKFSPGGNLRTTDISGENLVAP